MKHKCPRCEILPRSLKGIGGIKSKFVEDNGGTTLRIFVWNIPSGKTGPPFQMDRCSRKLGSLRNDGGEGNENGKKAMGLD